MTATPSHGTPSISTPSISTDGLTTIGFDADDTLWHSEHYFAVTEERFRALLAPWSSADEVADKLLQRERANLALFGYGIKGFTLSMIETALEATDGRIPAGAIGEIVEWGKEMLAHPVDLLDDVADTIDRLAGRYQLLLLTKGDLFHQESKIAESGLADRFDGIEVMSEKGPDDYRRALERHGADPAGFCMVGNSVRSDILPVAEIGGRAIHVPYAITWSHEQVETAAGTAADQTDGNTADTAGPPAWVTVESISVVRDLLG